MGIDRRRFLIAAGATAATLTIGETAHAETTTHTSHDWMAGAADTTTLDDLTIPGTHDTCALIGGPFDTAKCQDLTLPEQLSAGIRFVDIRCRLFEDAFTIHHGPIYQEKNFSDVLGEFRDFLTANDSETIIMSIQQEYSSEPEETFADMFNGRYMTDEGFDHLFYRDSRIPSLGEVRGKVVLVANSSHIGGIRAGDENLTSYQNDWEAPTDRKWDLIRDHLEAADAEKHDTTRLFVNYSSTTTGVLLPHPRTYARELNAMTSRYVADAAAGRPVFGVVVADFAGTETPELITNLIECNAFG